MSKEKSHELKKEDKILSIQMKEWKLTGATLQIMGEEYKVIPIEKLNALIECCHIVNGQTCIEGNDIIKCLGCQTKERLADD